MPVLSPRIHAVIAAIVLAYATTMFVLGPGAWRPFSSTEDILLAVILVIFIVGADFFDFDAPLASVHVTVSVSAALCFAAAIALGPVIGATVAGVSALTGEVLQRRELPKLLVNVTNYVFASFMGGWTYYQIADLGESPIANPINLAATVLAASVFSLIDSGTIAIVLSQVIETSPFEMWRANIRGVLFEQITLPTMGILVPVLKEESLLALAIAVIPLLGPYLAFRNYRQVHEETRATLEMLADLLDYRDPYTAKHSQRVSSMVREILIEIDGVPFEEVDVILTAARIHDLGKVTTSDATLMKPGRLDEEERLEIERHSSDGANMLGHMSIFRQVSLLVRHHHERWDGKGYPDGLSGTDIPFGSRVIAIADTYDAMTSDRVYRKALPQEIAVAEIRKHSGTQFDPAIVDAFLRAMGYKTAPAQPPAIQCPRFDQST